MQKPKKIANEKNESAHIKSSTTDSTSQKKVSFLRKNVIEICSVVIAFLVLILTIWQGCDNKKHNKLSVTPKIMFSSFNYPKDGGFDISVKNAGVGPAVIDEFMLRIKNKTYKVSELHGGLWYKVFEENQIPDSAVDSISHFYFDKGSYLTANESSPLIEFKNTNLSVDDYMKLASLIPDLSIVINYHSVYNDKFVDSFHVVYTKMIFRGN